MKDVPLNSVSSRKSSRQSQAQDPKISSPYQATFRYPTPKDGANMWSIAKESGTLDLNSSYAYLLWARDFSDTSIVAEINGKMAGFVTGYLRPDSPNILMVWQVATCARFRQQGIAGAMLSALFADLHKSRAVNRLETTVTDSNGPSKALFRRFAHRHGFEVQNRVLFEESDFPDSHETEILYQIGPLAPAS